MLITVVKEFTFDAAHRLPDYEGPCANLHGHTYRLQIGVQGEVDPVTGMVMDFKKLASIVTRNIINELDHHYLNDLSRLWWCSFPMHMPTAENMVVWIVQCLKIEIGLNRRYSLCLVRLWETPTSYAEWRAK